MPRTRNRRPVRLTYRPCLEVLEDRSLPAVHTWIGAVSPLWSNPLNWGGGVPTLGGGAVNDLVFVGPNSVNDLGNVPVSAITFQASSLVGGGPITLSGPINGNATVNTLNLGIQLVGSSSVNVPLGGRLQLLGPISDMAGPAGLNFTGLGTLSLAGANTFSDGVLLNGGTLQVGHNQALGSGELSVVSGAPTLQATGGARSLANSVTLYGTVVYLPNLTLGGDFNNNLTLTGLVSALGGLNFLTKSGDNTVTLTNPGNSIYATSVNAGVMLGVPSLTRLTVAAGARVDTGNGFLVVHSLAGSGVVNMNADDIFDGFSVNTGSEALDLSFSGSITGNGNFTYAGAFRGENQVGEGSLTLSGVNSYTGRTSVNNGTLRLHGTSSLPSSTALTIGGRGGIELLTEATIGSLTGFGRLTLGTSTLTVGTDGTSTEFDGPITGTGGLTKTGTGTLTLARLSDGAIFLQPTTNSYSGTTTVQGGGTLRIGNVGGMSTATPVFLNFNSTFSANNLNLAIASLAGFGPVTLGTGTLTVGGNDTSTAYSGSISGTGGLIKVGSGTLTLGSNSSYTGPTSVTTGTLIVNGSLSSTATTVAANATLMGIGELPIAANSLTIFGTVNPGTATAAGTLRAGSTTFRAGSSLAIRMGSSGTGGLSVLGSVNLSAGPALTVQVASGFTPALDSVVTIAGGNLVTGTFRNLPEGTVLDADGFAFRINYTSSTVTLTRINAPSPRVSVFTPTASGFTAQLSQAIEPAVLNLYDTQLANQGPADVALVGAATGPVVGTLVLSADNRSVTFIRTGGVLPADTYTLTLRSAANGFRNLAGDLLDGNRDGVAGDDFLSTFTVTTSAASVVSVPDFVRGTGQSVNVPVASAGLPLRLTSNGGVQIINLTLRYDPTLLAITGATLGSDSPATATVTLNTSTPGAAEIVFRSTTTPLGAGVLEFVRLTAAVPDTAPYGTKDLLSITDLTVNDGMARADDGIHLVSYLGDASRNASYSAMDGQSILRVATGLDSGFDNYLQADPRLLADVTGDGRINSTDALRVLQQAVGIIRPEFPPLPANPPTLLSSGPDPLLNLPRTFTGRPGDMVTVPVNLDLSDGLSTVDLALAYDSTRLEVLSETDIRRGTLTAGFELFQVNHDPATGTLRVAMASLRTEAFVDRGAGSVLEITFRVKDNALAGKAIINLLHDLGPTSTQLNEGGLLLVPSPSNEAGDALDGAIAIRRSPLPFGRRIAVADVTASLRTSPRLPDSFAEILRVLEPHQPLHWRNGIRPAHEKAVDWYFQHYGAIDGDSNLGKLDEVRQSGSRLDGTPASGVASAPRADSRR